MTNCIESDAMFGMCAGLQLREWWIMDGIEMDVDVYILANGSHDMLRMNSVKAYKLSDYLLATSQVDINKE